MVVKDAAGVWPTHLQPCVGGSGRGGFSRGAFGLGLEQRGGPHVAARSSAALRVVGAMATVPGSTGEFMWGGYGGTFFWVDPKEEIVAVYMSQAPGPSRQYYRRLFKQLVYQAVVD